MLSETYTWAFVLHRRLLQVIALGSICGTSYMYMYSPFFGIQIRLGSEKIIVVKKTQPMSNDSYKQCLSKLLSIEPVEVCIVPEEI